VSDVSKGGRPKGSSVYDPEKNKDVLEMMSNGATVVEVAVYLGISRETLYDWCNSKSPRFSKCFSDTINLGKLAAEAWTARDIRDNRDNPKYNHMSMHRSATNRFGWETRKSANVTNKIDTEYYSTLNPTDKLLYLRKLRDLGDISDKYFKNEMEAIKLEGDLNQIEELQTQVKELKSAMEFQKKGV